MKPTEAKILCEDIVNRVADMYNNEDIYGIDYYNQLIEDIRKLYHKDMVQIKVDLDMNNFEETTVIPAGSWVYPQQDEGGVYLWDDTMQYIYEFDYSVDPGEIIYE